MSAKDLASKLGLPERDIEHHLYHVRKSLHRQPHQYFHMVFPICWDCQYEFKARTKMTRPSRCPQCKSEDISSPKFSIENQKLQKGGKENRSMRQEGKENPYG